MAQHYHWVVWIDHREARLLSFNDAAHELQVLRAHGGGEHLHHRAGLGDAGRAPTPVAFYEAVATALLPAGEILLTGPGTAKGELMRHLEQKHADLARRVLKVESLDHPSDGQLLALARRSFKTLDRMQPQR